MKNKRRRTRAILLWVTFLTLSLPGCKTPSIAPVAPSVIIVDSSHTAQQTQPDTDYRFTKPGIWLEQGRYLQLMRYEQDVLAGRLVRVQP